MTPEESLGQKFTPDSQAKSLFLLRYRNLPQCVCVNAKCGIFVSLIQQGEVREGTFTRANKHDALAQRYYPTFVLKYP
jgi:hypothetical protein